MMERLKLVGTNIRQEIKVYHLVLKDRRTPWAARLLLGLALGYLLLPFDLIPDFVPILGHLDDVVVVPGLISLALRLVPKAVLEDCRLRAAQCA